MNRGVDMGACTKRDAVAQCAEIEDLLGILGVEVNVFRIVNSGRIEQLIQDLRRTIGDRRNG